MPNFAPTQLRPDLQLYSHSGDDRVAIYVHWPFCERKCPYCDFNSHVRGRIDQATWAAQYEHEIDFMAARMPQVRASSVFFGGGTPSLMPPGTVARILERIDKYWSLTDDTGKKIEVTLEANPSSSEASRFAAYKLAGVNRLSIGVQSLKDESLKFLGRLHSADEALRALDIGRTTFDRVSFDLIYALPRQTPHAWQAELAKALSFSPDHLSLYQLTIEEGTAFHYRYTRGQFQLPDEDTALALFENTQSQTEEAGLPAYEVSNHARAGQQSRHNLAYWTSQPYIGIGPGAHGRLPLSDAKLFDPMYMRKQASLSVSGSNAPRYFLATAAQKNPEKWLAHTTQDGHGVTEMEIVSPKDRFIEALMMGLRLKDGVDLRGLENRLGVSLSKVANTDKLDSLIEDGYLINENSHLKTTNLGRPLLNALLGQILA